MASLRALLDKTKATMSMSTSLHSSSCNYLDVDDVTLLQKFLLEKDEEIKFLRKELQEKDELCKEAEATMKLILTQPDVSLKGALSGPALSR